MKKLIIFSVLGIILWLVFAYLFSVSGATLGLITAIIFVPLTTIFLFKITERRVKVYNIIDYEEFLKERSGGFEGNQGGSISGRDESFRENSDTRTIHGGVRQQQVFPFSSSKPSRSGFVKPTEFERFS